MTVYYGNSNYKKCIGHPVTIEEANKIIYKYVTEVLGRTIYYTRHWINSEGFEVVDFGSWTDYCYISDQTTDEEVGNEQYSFSTI